MKALLYLLIGAALIGTAATAQRVPVPERPSNFQPSGPKVGAKDTRRVVQDFSRCMTRRHMSGVAQFLDQKMDRLSPVLRSVAPECLGNSFDSDESMLRGSADTYRMALAESYLVRKYREAGLGDVTKIAVLYPAAQGHQAEQGLGPLSECIIRKAPGQSWALLRTDAASAEEKAAFNALAPAMETCIPRGTTLKMQVFFMRGAIAEAFYQLSKAPRTPVAAK